MSAFSLVFFVATAVAAAQQVPDAVRRSAIASACGVAVADGVLQAGGPGYKATFRDGTFEYVPALGDRVEHTLPWSFRLQSIQRGGSCVWQGPADGAPPSHDSDNVVWQRGDVVERYDVRADGIEQSFVFASPPAGEGELVVTGRIETELVPRANADGSWHFERAGVGGVRLGQVVGIDAAGRRVLGTARVHGDSLELVLPGQFVASATYPLVLDPLIGTEFLVSAADNAQPDCAYDHSTGRWLIVWQHRFSVLNIEVRGVRIDADTGAVVGAMLLFGGLAPMCWRPRVAGIGGADHFLVAYQQATSPFGPFDIRLAMVDAATGLVTLGPTLVGSTQEAKPCVSGEANNLGDSGLLVWEQDGIRVGKYQLTPAGPSPISFATITASPLAHEPAVSRTGGVVGRHVVTWTETMLGSNTDLYARAVSRDLVLLTPATVLTSGSSIDTQSAIDGDGQQFVVAFSRREPTGTLRDVRCLRIDAPGPLLPGPTLAIEATPNQDEFGPDIAWLGPKYCVTFVERSAPLQDDVCAWLVDSSCTTCNARITLTGVNGTTNSNREWAPRVAGRWVYAQNGFNDDGLVVLTESLDVPPFSGVITGQRVEALGPGLAPVHLGGACGNGGTPSISVPFVVGNSAFHFFATGLEPSALVLLNLGLPGAPLPCGACSLLAPIALELKTNVAGTASSLLVIPCDAGLAGFQLEFQWISILTSVSPCPLLTGMSASERVQLTLGN